jgi:hypothetical protein
MARTFPTMTEHFVSTAGVVVCEKAGLWAAAWRRELSPLISLVETRFPDDAWRQLEVWPQGVLALEIRPQSAPQMVAMLTRAQTELPQVLCVAHLPETMADWELLVREAGAAAVVFTPRRLASAADLAERHLARAPRPQLSLREQVWRQLPWNASPSH